MSREPKTMSPETREKLAENRKKKKAREVEERVAAIEARENNNDRPSWREVVLRRYVVHVLRLSGRARLEFMEDHSIGELFR